MSEWKPEHIDEIVLYGDINCKRQMRKMRRQNLIKPCEIAEKIYLKRAKVLTEFCERIEKGCFEPTEMKIIQSHIESVLNEYSTIVVTYCDQCYAIWSEENAFYIFNSEDVDERGNLVEKTKGASCAIRSTSLKKIVNYLVGNFKITKQRFEVNSFQVFKVIRIEEELAKIYPPKKKIVEEKVEIFESKPEVENENFALEEEAKSSAPKTGLSAILFRHQPEPIFGDSYQRSSLPYHGYITCAEFVEKLQEDQVPFISSVAIIMLRICKSSIWQPSTLSKIIQVGENLFIENVEKHFEQIKVKEEQLAKALVPDPVPPKEPNPDAEEDDEDEEDEFSVANIRARRREKVVKPVYEVIVKQEYPITEFDNLIVDFGNIKFEMKVENEYIGKVITRKPGELT